MSVLVQGGEKGRERGAAQGRPGRPQQGSLYDAPSDLHAAQTSTQERLGQGDSAAPPDRTCAAHVSSRGVLQARRPREGGRGSGGQNGCPGGPLGISAKEEGAGALRAGCSQTRREGPGSLAGHLRPARCACECVHRRQPPRPAPPSAPRALPAPPAAPTRALAPRARARGAAD